MDRITGSDQIVQVVYSCNSWLTHCLNAVKSSNSDNLYLIRIYTERIKKRRVNGFDDSYLGVMRDSENIHMGRKKYHSLINS